VYEDPLDNPYLYLWVLASIVSSIYAYTWDIKMDWGLFDKSAGEHRFLREETVYSSAVSTTDRLVRPKFFSYKREHIFAYYFIFQKDLSYHIGRQAKAPFISEFLLQ
jgi:hypothetical protein